MNTRRVIKISWDERTLHSRKKIAEINTKQLFCGRRRINRGMRGKYFKSIKRYCSHRVIHFDNRRA